MSEEVKSVNSTQGSGSTTVQNDAPKKRRRKRRIIQNLKCPLCESGVKYLSYKDVYQLKKFTSVRGKIISTEKSGMCHKHQKQLRRAIKRARYMALLPYVARE
ncbi:TPA: 30S ribosomal protein S18 [Patescibacteria group bacterium]|nr:30S ribosomal protein S18 [Patescibacteria group bacterium]